MRETIHRPVLVEEVIRHLAIRPDGLYIDGTVGTGGHAWAILSRLDKGRVLGIDRDAEALQIASERLLPFGERGLLLHGSYEDLEPACRVLGTRQVDGILLDLGISSLQIGLPGRGFAFSREGPLDMRMDQSCGETVEDFVNQASLRRIERVLREYGEEPCASGIARAIVEERRKRRIGTTTELASLVFRTMPRRARLGKIHPATRTFQAFRIAVNCELDRLDRFLEEAPLRLRAGGRLVILSYHSLEDRRVKRSFLRRESEGVLMRVTKKPVRPDEAEIRANPRSRSAKLRVAEKVEGL